VWLVSGADAQSDKELMGARACLTSVQAGSVIPERPASFCNGPGADAFDPRVQSKLRGVPVPPADAEGGAPAQTNVEVDRPESVEPEVPRCTVGLPSRRAPLVFDTSALADVQALQAGDDRVGCFESCEQLAIGAGDVAPNVLQVKTPPRIERFLPEVGQISPLGTHRVERGPMTLAWRIRSEEPPAITLERWQAPAENVPAEGSAQFDALWPSQATLVAENACGRVTRTLDIEPVTTLFVQPDHLDLGQADEVEARVITDAPLGEDLEVALDDKDGGDHHDGDQEKATRKDRQRGRANEDDRHGETARDDRDSGGGRRHNGRRRGPRARDGEGGVVVGRCGVRAANLVVPARTRVEGGVRVEVARKRVVAPRAQEHAERRLGGI
jgi:hypothetical protein